MGKTLSLLLALLLSHGLSLFSQHKITGVVTGGEDEPLQYVTVSLLGLDSSFVKGCMTDTLGAYRMDGVVAGDYVLAFDMLGYEPEHAPVYISGDVKMDVRLNPASEQLGEVTVKGSTFIRQEDKLLIIPDKVSVKHSVTGYDLLDNLMIPGVDVDRRKGTVASPRGSVTLYIDGRKVDYREVQTLRPRDVEKIEYMDLPTGKYALDITAINFVTKQYDSGGYVSLYGAQGIGYLDGDYNANAKLAHGNTSYTVIGGYMTKQYHNHGTRHEEMMFPGGTVARDLTTIDALNGRRQQYVQMNVANSNDRHNIVAKASLVNDNPPEMFDNSMLVYSGIAAQDVSAGTLSTQKGIQPGASLFGDFKIKDNQDFQISLTGIYSNNRYDRSYTENGNTTATMIDEGIYSATASAIYNLRLKKKNSFGVQLYHFQTVSNSDYSGTYEQHQQLISGESLLFALYSHKFGDKFKLFLRPGISSLNYKLNGDRTHEYSLRLNTTLIYSLTEGSSIAWGINIGNSSPQISMLNDAEQDIDS